MMNMLELLCRAGSPSSPVCFPARVLSFAMGISPDEGVVAALEEFERRGWVTLDRDPANGHILAAAPTPAGRAAARESAPSFRPLPEHNYADT